MSKSEKGSSETMPNIALILAEIIGLGDKGVAIFNDEKFPVEVNERFYKIFNINKSEISLEAVSSIFQKYKIHQNTEYLVIENVHIEITYKNLALLEKQSLGIYIFERVEDDIIHKRILEGIVKFGQDGVHAVNLKGEMIYYNEKQGEIDHLVPDEVLGKKVVDVYALNEETSLLLTVLRTEKEIRSVRQTYYTKKGVFIDCVTSVVPLFYHDKIVGSLAIVRDYYEVLKTLKPNVSSKDMLGDNKDNLNKYTRYTFNNILTVDKEFQKNLSIAKNSGQTDTNVIIIGETGTGKEMVAQSIHDYSTRRGKPFVAINCAAIPESLLESLLFGTSKGSFTGAVDKAGLFEEANGGTIFLDEINSMSLSLQSKLLRVLEEKTVTRLGSNNLIHIDTRIISSCNENPAQSIRENRLRSDLFYRLAVIYVVIPSLRKRRKDIEMLTKHFINKYSKKYGKKIDGVTEELNRFLMGYSWPGNVRQLKNMIESAVHSIPNYESAIRMEDLPKYLISEEDIQLFDDGKQRYEKDDCFMSHDNNNIFIKIEERERNSIVAALERNRGNISKTARELGISRQKVYYRLKKYDIK